MGNILRPHAASGAKAYAGVLLVSVLSLAGCTTTSKQTAALTQEDDQAVPVIASAAGQNPTPGAVGDSRVAVVGSGAQPMPAYSAGTTAMMPQAADGQRGPLMVQSTGVKAVSSSIFAVQTPMPLPVAAEPSQAQSATPLPVNEATGVNAMSNSLFNSGQPPARQMPLPLEGASSMDNTVKKTVALSDIAAPGGKADEQAAKSLTLVGLFAAKRKSRKDAAALDRADDARAKAGKRTISGAADQPQQIAALGFTALPGRQTTTMFATMDDDERGHADESPAIVMASLSGLARLAPNGLWLQTDTVETGCFQPNLLRLLKDVETHYGRKLVVTSGRRDMKHNASVGGGRHSLHTTCEAADIQLPGISKWDLADYLRTLPGRGGVGTYCHTQSVHIDTGEKRDWNWSCGERQI